MTPEERAQQIANGYFLGNPLEYERLEREIAGAIRMAEAKAAALMRERCAEVARQVFLEGEENANTLGRKMIKAIKEQ